MRRSIQINLNWAIPAAFLLLLVGCGPGQFDAGNPLGKQGIVDAANRALSQGDCGGALEKILPVYESGNTDNTVRMITASAYACAAGVNLFKLTGDLASNSDKLAGSGFWGLLAQLFPSSAQDKHVEAAKLSSFALFSTLQGGSILDPTQKINPGTYNVGSTVKGDRLPDANAYLIFVSMSLIGALENRYGSPDPTSFKRTADMPWTTAATVTTDGCTFAAGLVNFVDSIGSLANSVDGQLKANLTTLKDTFESGIFQACDYGCSNADPDGPGPWVASGCTSTTTHCTQCPLELRDPTRCTSQPTDAASCAAAGLANFINANGVGWAKAP